MRRFKTQDITGLKPQHAAFVIQYIKDFSPRRAAEAVGYEPEHGHILMQRADIKAAVQHALKNSMEASQIDAEWLLLEVVDNHMIARQQGNISASNSALKLVAQHVFVDALAANRMEVELHTDAEVKERLLRGRQRIAALRQGVDQDDDNDDPEEVSFL